MSTCCSLLPEVETAALVSSSIAGTPGNGSPESTPIRQPRCPGGASLNARSPLTATSALRTPSPPSTSIASLAA